MFCRKLILAFGLLVTVILIGCQTSSQINDQESSEGEIRQPIHPPSWKAEVRTLHSDIMDQDFKVYIGLPDLYNDTERNYPVVYLIGGDFLTMQAWTSAFLMAAFGEMPPVIIAGIGYGGDNISEAHDIYAMDTSMRTDDHVQFIKEELIPEIEANYRAEPTDRVLLGYGDGGSVVIKAMFYETDLFQRYILINKPLWMSAVDDEKIYAESHDDLPISLYLSVAGLNDTDEYSDFYDVLSNREYPNLKMELDIKEGETNITVIPGAISSGLKSVFRRED